MRIRIPRLKLVQNKEIWFMMLSKLQNLDVQLLWVREKGEPSIRGNQEEEGDFKKLFQPALQKSWRGPGELWQISVLIGYIFICRHIYLYKSTFSGDLPRILKVWFQRGMADSSWTCLQLFEDIYWPQCLQLFEDIYWPQYSIWQI